MIRFSFANSSEEARKKYTVEACFAGYYSKYSKDMDYYVCFTSEDSCLTFVDNLNKRFKYINIECDTNNGRTEFKIECSKKYNELPRYIVLYMVSVILAYFNADESFYDRENTITLEDFVRNTNISKKEGHGNSNHLIYSFGGQYRGYGEKSYKIHNVYLKDVRFLFNPTLMNKHCSKPFTEAGSHGNSTIGIGNRFFQTSVINYIKKVLKEKNNATLSNN